MTKLLKKDTVEAYAERHMLIDKLEREENKDRKRIIKLMKRGFESPTGIAFRLQLTEQERRDLSWKEEWQVLARRFMKKAWRKEMRRIIDNADITKTPMLLIKPQSQNKNVVEFKRRKKAA